MNLATIPLLIVALILMATSDPAVETVDLVLTGQHQVEDQRGALVVGDAEVTMPADARLPGPIYVIGGRLVVHGSVDGDLTQLAGTVRVESGATIGGELRHIGGSLDVSDLAEIGRRTTVAVIPAQRGLIATYLPAAVVALVLALVGARLTRKRATALDNVADAIAGHPVVSLTMGALLTLTFIALFVFMAFTLILIPVAILGALIGLITLAYGVIAWGHLLGRRLNRLSTGRATALGVVIVVILTQLVSLIPLIGDLIVIGALAGGLGAVVLTYFGAATFKPAALPD